MALTVSNGTPLTLILKKGQYTVSLTISNAAGSHTATSSVTALEPPAVSFSALETRVAIDKSVQFKDESTGDIDSWSWDFGDGTTSTVKNPTHAYKKAGKYAVSLTVSNSTSSNTKKETDYIVVTSLHIENMYFCADVTDWGGVVQRESDSFKVGELAQVYYNVLGFAHGKTDASAAQGSLEVWLTFVGKVTDPKGNVQIFQNLSEFHKYYATQIDLIRNLANIRLFRSSDLKGVYTVEVTVEDKVSGEIATSSRSLLLE